MATSSQAASAAKGLTGPKDFYGIEASLFVVDGLGSGAFTSNEGSTAHVAGPRGLSIAQPHIDVEGIENEGVFGTRASAGDAP